MYCFVERLRDGLFAEVLILAVDDSMGMHFATSPIVLAGSKVAT